MNPYSQMSDESLIDQVNMRSIREPASYELACRLHAALRREQSYRMALAKCHGAAEAALSTEED